MYRFHVRCCACLLVGLRLGTVEQDGWVQIWAVPLTRCVFLS